MSSSGSIVIIEDNLVTQKVYEKIFNKTDYRVHMSADLKEFMTHVLQHKPEICICDVTLGLNGKAMGGFTAAQFVKLLDKFYDTTTKVIIITGHDNFIVQDKSHVEHFDYYLPKPLNKQVILSLVNDIKDELLNEKYT